MSGVEPERRAGGRARRTAPGAVVETAGCRRAILLRHFGETPPPTCGNCDNCLNPPAAIDATETARKFLSAVFRTGQMFGVGYRSEERRVGKECVSSVDLGGRRIIKTNIHSDMNTL